MGLGRDVIPCAQKNDLTGKVQATNESNITGVMGYLYLKITLQTRLIEDIDRSLHFQHIYTLFLHRDDCSESVGQPELNYVQSPI